MAFAIGGVAAGWPLMAHFAVLVNPNNPDTEANRSEVHAAAQTIGQQLILHVSSDRDIETTFGKFVQRGAGALLVGGGRSCPPWGKDSSRWLAMPRLRFRQSASSANPAGRQLYAAAGCCKTTSRANYCRMGKCGVDFKGQPILCSR